MAAYVMLTRLGPEAAQFPRTLETLEHQVARAVRESCPGVEWVTNLALLGPYDYLDIFHAPSEEDALRVAAIVRLAGHAQTEVWGAIPWERFKAIVAQLPEDIGRSVVTH